MLIKNHKNYRSGLCLVLLLIVINSTYASAEDMRIHRYASSEKAWNTNAYWIESDTGIVMIDSLLLQSDMDYLLAQIRANGKPLEAVFITHPHYDHIAGIKKLKQAYGDMKVYATKETIQHTPAVIEQFKAGGFFKIYEGDIETSPLLPTDIVKDGDELQIAGMRFVLHQYGPGEALDHLLIEMPEHKAVFVGDVLMSSHPNWYGEGRIDEVIQQLQRFKNEFTSDTTVLSGHGDPVGVGIVDQQLKIIADSKELIETARLTTSNLNQEGRLKHEVLMDLSRQLVERYDYMSYFGITPQVFTSWNLSAMDLWIKNRSEH